MSKQNRASNKEAPKFIPSECLARYLAMLRDMLTDEEEEIYRSVGNEVASLEDVVKHFSDASWMAGVLSLPLNARAIERGESGMPESFDAAQQLLLKEGHWEKAHQNILKIKELLESKNFRIRQISELENVIAGLKSTDK